MNQTGEAGGREPVALPRNLRFQLPLGLIGDPQATEQCPMLGLHRARAGLGSR